MVPFRKALKKASERDIPEFRQLVKAAKGEGIKWQYRHQLYKRLKVPKERQEEIERKIVAHLSQGRLTSEVIETLVHCNVYRQDELLAKRRAHFAKMRQKGRRLAK